MNKAHKKDRQNHSRGELQKFKWGTLSIKEMRGILDALPMDINFIDKNDLVQYYNESPGRVHERNPEVFGRHVQDCHLEANRKKVMATLEVLRTGKREIVKSEGEAFGRPALWRYLAVRDKDGDYLGALCITEYLND